MFSLIFTTFLALKKENVSIKIDCSANFSIIDLYQYEYAELM